MLVYCSLTKGEPLVKVTAPVNPVDIGGIFSLHCQVWNLDEGQEVTLLKLVNGKAVRITLDDTIMAEDDRMFLAMRQLNDGSTVYFLSVIEAVRNDESEYQCKIIDTAGSAHGLPSVSVNIGVIYYPETEPNCAYKEPLVVKEGAMASFNCSSEAANPIVTIRWLRTGSEETLDSREIVQNDRKVSYLTFRTKLSDHNVMFTCEVSSLSFPDKTKTCHVGPLLITPKSGSTVSTSDRHPSMDDRITQDKDNDIPFKTTGIAKRPPNKIDDCSEVCLSSKSLESKWILATVFSGCAAFIFLILGLVLFVKYLNTRSPYTRPRYIATPKPHTDGIYSELECKQGDAKMYMTLQCKQRELTAVAQDDNRSGRYDPMPNVPKL